MADDNLRAQNPEPPRTRMSWPASRTIGTVSELAVLAPVRAGSVPGERRTYEERLRAAIANLARRHEQGIPTELDKVGTIHFGRLIILRPEQYLYAHSGAQEDGRGTDGRVAEPGQSLTDRIETYRDADDNHARREQSPEFRSWLLTLVEFDGDLRVYMNDIAKFMGDGFDILFRNCEDYPGTRPFEAFWLWIRRFQIPTDLFYAAQPTVSVARLSQLETFKRQFDAFVTRVRGPEGIRVGSMDELFDDFLRENQQYATGFPMPGGTFLSKDLHHEH